MVFEKNLLRAPGARHHGVVGHIVHGAVVFARRHIVDEDIARFLAPQPVDMRVEHDPARPGPEIGVRLETAEPVASLHHGFLIQILGILVAPRQHHGLRPQKSPLPLDQRFHTIVLCLKFHADPPRS